MLAPDTRTILVLPRHADIPEAELTPFAEIVRLPLIQISKSLTSLALFGPALISSGIRLRALLARSNADAVLVNDFFQLQAAVARLLGYRGQIVTWIRIDPRIFPKRLARLWLAAAYRCSDQVVAVSDYIAALVPPSAKLRRIYDAIDTKLAVGTRVGVRSDVVQVGNYIPGKGQDDALDAFLAIAADFPESRLCFFGGDMGLDKNRAFRGRLEARARSSGFGDRIMFGDFAADLGSALATAAVAVNLSRSESFSLTCLEAGQLGLPVVAYRSGGPEEIIVDGVTGYLCEIGDVAAVAQALRRLLADPAHGERMGQAAAVHVADKFSPARFVDQIRQLLAPAGQSGR